MTPTLHPPKPDRSADGPSPIPAQPFPYGEETAGSQPQEPPTAVVLRSSDGPDGVPGSVDCPTCGTATTNGAGLFTCPDCSWTGVLENST